MKRTLCTQTHITIELLIGQATHKHRSIISEIAAIKYSNVIVSRFLLTQLKKNKRIRVTASNISIKKTANNVNIPEIFYKFSY